MSSEQHNSCKARSPAITSAYDFALRTQDDTSHSKLKSELRRLAANIIKLNTAIVRERSLCSLQNLPENRREFCIPIHETRSIFVFTVNSRSVSVLPTAWAGCPIAQRARRPATTGVRATCAPTQLPTVLTRHTRNQSPSAKLIWTACRKFIPEAVRPLRYGEYSPSRAGTVQSMKSIWRNK